ncbi:MHYT domain-containing protein [Yinghuangia soli]|uniref:MHYT domain-containing protein n=1 Tax=Yinghuangia soli TaxID=2908204 RepID=A0AA41PXX7_9ACTN|nr:MHYT domain-containing protein [Yinghuangia soli]MCF2527918.1 hypothetical protein [Yinghuangia soli]
MGHIHHFSSGPLTPVLAYAMSCVGAALGLLCTSRARALSGWSRSGWFALAAVSIGGTGIWVMHFIAMLGFSVEGTPLRYDVTRTVVSLLVSVAVVAAGLVTAATGRSRWPRLVAGGVLTGTGVAAMHYLGMSAMNMRGSLGYATPTVVASVVIAIAAATAALWFALNVRGALATTGAALAMGVAVCGMHYTGMSALSAKVTATAASVPGAETSSFIAPLITGISLFTVVTLFIVALSPTEDELLEDADFDERLDRLTRGREQSYENFAG